MASNFTNPESESKIVVQGLRKHCICPVCIDDFYDDPRNLDCGHFFCLKCLKPLVRRTDISPDGEIECPVCQKITRLDGKSVDQLPPPFIFRCLQEIIQQIPRQANEIKRVCTKCGERKASTHCLTCKRPDPDYAYPCEVCFKRHQTAYFEGTHDVVPYDEIQYCEDHEGEAVEQYCADGGCRRLVCKRCILDGKTHDGHDVKPITEELLEKCREDLLDIKTRQQSQLSINQQDIEKLHKIAIQMTRYKEDIGEKRQMVMQACENLMREIKRVLSGASQKVDDEVGKITDVILELQRVSVAQQKTSGILDTLLEADSNTVTKAQVVVGAMNIKGIEPALCTNITEVAIETPILGDKYEEIADTLNGLARAAVEVECRTDVIKIRHGAETESWNLQRAGMDIDVNPGAKIGGIAYDGGSKNLLLSLRDKDQNDPTDIYFITADNHLKYMIRLDVGRHGDGPQKGGYRQLQVDTRRDLILMLNGSSLVRLTRRNGSVKDSLDIGGNLMGISHESVDDLYAVSSVSDNGQGCVYLVSSVTMRTVATIGAHKTFQRPKHLRWGRINGTKILAISDCGRNEILIYKVHCVRKPGERVDESDLEKGYEFVPWPPRYELIEKLGPKLGDLGTMSAPLGMAIDERGRLLVCDTGNCRVLRIDYRVPADDCDGEREVREKGCEILLRKSDFRGNSKPLDVDIDGENRLLSVLMGHDHHSILTFTY